MTLQLRIVAHSEVGPVRKNNQDSGYVSPHLLLVADGMGGAAAGDLASAVAVDTIRTIDEAVDAGEQMLERLAGAMHQANDRIADLVEQDYALEGMGTTVTGTLFDGAQFGLAHIGDSRAYLMHDNRLERLTHDHSWVQSLIDNGKLKESEAAVHPHRSLLLKVLNGQPANDPDLTLVPVVPGDRLLLCSDGLCGLVDDRAIEEAMRDPDLQGALDRLVAEALDEGGYDNITVVIAEVTESAPVTEAVVLGAAADQRLPRTPPRRGPAAALAAPVAGDTDTDETDVPAASVAAGTGDDEARYHPQPPTRRPVGRRLVLALVAAVLVGVALAGGYAWTQTQFYVAADQDRVAIFQGLDEDLPGIKLSRLYEVQPLAVSSLPPYYQERVRNSIDVSGLSGARQTVQELTVTAHRCAAAAASRRRPPPAPRPSISASTGASVTASTSPGTTTTSATAPEPSAPAASRSVAGPSPSPRRTAAVGSAGAPSGSSSAAPGSTC